MKEAQKKEREIGLCCAISWSTGPFAGFAADAASSDEDSNESMILPSHLDSTFLYHCSHVTNSHLHQFLLHSSHTLTLKRYVIIFGLISVFFSKVSECLCTGDEHLHFSQYPLSFCFASVFSACKSFDRAPRRELLTSLPLPLPSLVDLHLLL